MSGEMTYEELELRVKELEKEVSEFGSIKNELLSIRKAIDSTSDAIGMSDPQGSHFYQNDAFTDLFEYTADELGAAGVGPLIYVAPDIARDVFKSIMCGQSWNGEIEMVSKSGRRFPVDLRADAIKDETGSIIGLIGIHTDVTKRKKAEEELKKHRDQLEDLVAERTKELSKINEALQLKIIESEHAEEELRESEEKYRNLIDLIPDPITIIQGNKNKLINTAFTELFGYTLKDLEKGTTIFDLVRDQDRDAVRKRMKDRMAGKVPMPRYDCVNIVKKDGNIVPCEVTGSLINYEHLPADLAIFRDITERSHAEEALRASNRKFSAAFQSSPNAIVISHLKDGRIKDVNDSFVQMSGYSREEVIGNTTIGLGLWKETGMRMKITQALQKEGQLHNFEVTFGRKSGERGMGLLSVAIIELEGESFILGTLTDITGNKQIEKALRQSEGKFRSLVNLTSDWVWETDKSGMFTFVDPKVKDFLGYEPEEILEKRVTDIIIELDENKAALFLQKYQKFFREFEVIHVHKDGHHLWVESSGEPFFDTEGNMAGWRGISRNITDRKQAQEALRESEGKYRSFVEVTSDWIWEMDEHGIFTYVDPKIEKFIGYEAKEVIGKPMFDFMPYENGKQAKYFLHEFNKLRKPFPMVENTHVHKNGTEVVCETSGVPTFAKDGKLTGWKGLNKDISERKTAEDELRRLRNMLTNIIDSMPSMLVGVDADGKVTQWNKTAEQTTGIAAGVAQGKTLSDVFPPMASEMEKIAESIRTQEAKQDRKKPRLSKNGTCYEDVIIYPLVANGVQGAVIRIDDVTDKVRMEEMMIQSEKMLSVGGLAAGMAHEINNPLAGIMQNVQVIKNRMSRDLPKNIEAAEECGTSIETIEAYMEKRGLFEMIDLVMESGKRAAKIVDNMLSFSRKSDESFASHSLCDLLDKTVELAGNDYDLKKKLDFRQIEIFREYDDSVPDINCEAGKIQQVFLNILKNATQAMAESKDKGETPRFILRVMQEGDMARVEIEDNGPGMDENTHTRVFEPFYTTKPVGTGTGLGMSVSYFIITENHDGNITVESKPGKGSKFIIQLPFKRTVS